MMTDFSFDADQAQRLAALVRKGSALSFDEKNCAIDLHVKERMQHPSNYRLVQTQAGAADLYEDVWRDVATILHKRRDKLKFPLRKSLLDKMFFQQFLKAIDWKKRSKAGYRTTLLESDVAARQQSSSELRDLDSVDSKHYLELIETAVTPEEWEQYLVHYRNLRRLAVARWPKNEQWLEHWLPYLLYKCVRVKILDEASFLISFHINDCSKAEQKCLEALPVELNEGDYEFHPRVWDVLCQDTLRNLLACSTAPEQEWIAVRTDAVVLLPEPYVALSRILGRRDLRDVISRFERSVGAAAVRGDQGNQ